MATVRDVISSWRQTVELRQLPSNAEYAAKLWVSELRALLVTYGFTEEDLLAVTDDDPERWMESEYAVQSALRHPAAKP